MWTFEILKRFGRQVIVLRCNGEPMGQASPYDDEQANNLLAALDKGGLTEYKDESK